MICSFLISAVFSLYVRDKHRVYEGHGEDGARYILKFLDYERVVANPRLFAQVCPLQFDPNGLAKRFTSLICECLSSRPHLITLKWPWPRVLPIL